MSTWRYILVKDPSGEIHQLEIDKRGHFSNFSTKRQKPRNLNKFINEIGVNSMENSTSPDVEIKEQDRSKESKINSNYDSKVKTTEFSIPVNEISNNIFDIIFDQSFEQEIMNSCFGIIPYY